MTATTRIQLRTDTAANWIAADPILSAGELGFESDTFMTKIGNGSDAWTDLQYESGLVPNGTVGAPNAITAVGGISIQGIMREVQFVVGSGAITVTANPQIEVGTVVGQELILFGTSDSNTVTVSNGTGLGLNGACTLRNKASLYLVWNGSIWCEVSRNDN